MLKNTVTIRNLYEAFGRGDIPAVLEALDPEIHWYEAEGFPYGGLYVGPQAVLEGVFAKLGSEWEGFAAVPDRFVTEGDTVVALGSYRGEFKATGKAIDVPMVHVWKFRDGRVAEFRQHTDTALVRDATT